jgi:nucleoside-diphosphate-sugar epimerase
LKLAIENNSKLVAAENLYMYGNTHGKPMSETTAINPCTKKGRVRAEMTNALAEAASQGKVRLARVRGSDFFGPWEPINGAMIFEAALKRKTINMLGKLDQPHSFTYVKDFGKALAIAGTEDNALGKVWHVPSGEPITQRQLIELVSEQLGYPLKVRPTGKFVLSLIGLFKPSVKEVVEMLYEFNKPFIIEARAMQETFGFTATPYEKRIAETLDWASKLS